MNTHNATCAGATSVIQGMGLSGSRGGGDNVKFRRRYLATSFRVISDVTNDVTSKFGRQKNLNSKKLKEKEKTELGVR